MTNERKKIVKRTWRAGRYLWDGRTPFLRLIEPDDSDILPGPFYPVKPGKIKRIDYTMESVGYVTDDGDVYEWWNIICEGHIIDCERFESRYKKFAERNIF